MSRRVVMHRGTRGIGLTIHSPPQREILVLRHPFLGRQVSSPLLRSCPLRRVRLPLEYWLALLHMCDPKYDSLPERDNRHGKPFHRPQTRHPLWLTEYVRFHFRPLFTAHFMSTFNIDDVGWVNILPPSDPANYCAFSLNISCATVLVCESCGLVCEPRDSVKLNTTDATTQYKY